MKRINRNLLQFMLAMVVFCTVISANAYPFLADWDDLFAPEGLAPQLTGAERTTSTNFPTLTIRGDNMLAVNAIEDTEFTINVMHSQLGSYTDPPSWELRTKDNTLLDSGNLLFDQADSISYQHDKTEVLYLYISTGRNCFYIIDSDVNVGVVCGVMTKFLANNNRKIYFSVPVKVSDFTVTLYAGSTSEHVKVKVYNSSDTLVTQGETDSSHLVVDVPVTVGDDDDAVWYLEINIPSSGNFEDYAIKLSPNLPPVLSMLAGDTFSYAPFGKNEKLAVLVDKVMAASTSYLHAPWMIDAAKNSGFNTYVPRRFYGDSGTTGPDPTQFAQLAGWCDDRDMKTLAWMRGTHIAPFEDSSLDGKRYRPGADESRILSPNSDEFWSYLNTYISQYATLSRTYPSILGVFLDFEDYYTSSLTHAYYISYDDVIIDKYEAARSITVNATPEGRMDWLINNNYHDDFVEFQIDYWRTKCAELRATVDAINPQFRFFVYPFTPYYNVPPPFLFGGDIPIAKFSTPQAPIVHAEVTSYGTAPYYSIVHNAEAIIYGVNKKLDLDFSVIEHDAPYMMLAGYCTSCYSNLEFLARAPIAAAEKMDGYWVFYCGFDYPSDEHDLCMEYFDTSNDAIANEDYAAAVIPYEDSNYSWDSLWSIEGEAPDVEGTLSHDNEVYSVCKIRGLVPMFIACEADEPVTVKLNFLQVGSYDKPLGWELRSSVDLDTTIQCGTVFVGETSETITFTPTVTGNYILVIAPLTNTFYVDEADACWAYYAGKPVHFFLNSQPLYINVPSGVSSFTLTAESAGPNELVKVSVYNPDNTLVAQDETSSTDLTKVITVNVGTYGSGAWKIITSAASTGNYEDFFLTVGSEIPQFISLNTDNLFSP